MNIKHTPEPTRYGFCGKYMQEQSNGEYIKACHYDVIKQQRDELMEALVEIRDSNGWIVTEHKYLKLLASEAIAKARAA